MVVACRPGEDRDRGNWVQFTRICTTRTRVTSDSHYLTSAFEWYYTNEEVKCSYQINTTIGIIGTMQLN